MGIKWPSGPTVTKFRKFAQDNQLVILNRTVLAIDPSSKSCGWARYVAGEYVASGTIIAPAKLPINKRLGYLYNYLPDIRPEIVVVEQIRGSMSHEFLKYAVGTILTKYSEVQLEFCPIPVWKALAKKIGMKKSDENDARMMAESLILLAKDEK